MTCSRTPLIENPGLLWWIFLALIVSIGVFDLFVLSRVMRQGHFKMYKDERLNPTGRRAIAYILVPTIITWAVAGVLLWLTVCTYLRGEPYAQ